MKRVLLIAGISLAANFLPVFANETDIENKPCEITIIEEKQYDYSSQLIQKIKMQRDSIYNALNLTPSQIKCIIEIDKKRYEALVPELQKLCLFNKKLKQAMVNCDKTAISGAEKDLKCIRKTIQNISLEYDEKFMKILNSEQKAKYRMIRKLKRSDLKKMQKIQKNGSKPSDVKPFGEKISQPAYTEQRHNETCIWHKLKNRIKH